MCALAPRNLEYRAFVVSPALGTQFRSSACTTNSTSATPSQPSFPFFSLSILSRVGSAIPIIHPNASTAASSPSTAHAWPGRPCRSWVCILGHKELVRIGAQRLSDARPAEPGTASRRRQQCATNWEGCRAPFSTRYSPAQSRQAPKSGDHYGGLAGSSGSTLQGPNRSPIVEAALDGPLVLVPPRHVQMPAMRGSAFEAALVPNQRYPLGYPPATCSMGRAAVEGHMVQRYSRI